MIRDGIAETKTTVVFGRGRQYSVSQEEERDITSAPPGGFSGYSARVSSPGIFRKLNIIVQRHTSPGNV